MLESYVRGVLCTKGVKSSLCLELLQCQNVRPSNNDPILQQLPVLARPPEFRPAVFRENLFLPVRIWASPHFVPVMSSEKFKPSIPAEASAASPEQVPEWLSNRLRRMFTEVMDEPVPDEFKKLLKQLEEKERGA